jgi:hypothetical protein
MTYSLQHTHLVQLLNAVRIKERKSNMYTQDNSPFKKVRKTKEGLALKRWFKEDWRTPSGSKDYSDGDVVFRPTKKVSKDTPKTYSELSEADIKKGRRQKRKTGRAGKYGA